jgi:protein disulfide-isomerase
VEVDFPHGKKLSEDQELANKTLAAKYDIEGFPTVMLLDPQGKKLGKPIVGYADETPTQYVQQLEKMLAKQKKKKSAS